MSYMIAAVVALATLLLYLPALRNGFVNWDDPHYVFNNTHIRSLNPEFFRWAFSDASVYWQPLTWISHALDYAMWGLKPNGHHLTSIVLHAINTFIAVRLSFSLLGISLNDSSSMQPDRRAVMIGSGVVGILFGIHPIHVESVAWAAERKDLLYSFFYMLSIVSYTGYAARLHGDGREGSWYRDRGYLAALLLFVLSLCSKPMAVTLPAVLLLMDWYFFGRFNKRESVTKVLLEKVPFLALSIIVSIVTFIAQKKVGAVASLEAAPFTARVLVACKSLMLYLWDILVPVKLLPLYPYPGKIGIMMPEFFIPLAVVAGITAMCVMNAGKRPVWLAVWAYFVVTLLPVLGLVQSGPQAMADRFSYLPSLGPFLLIGVAAAFFWTRTASVPTARKAAVLAAGLLTITLSSLSLRQIAVWRDGITLWSYTIDGLADRFSEPYYLRGIAFGDAGDFDKAIGDYTVAIGIDPKYGPAYINRGVAFLERGEADRAIQDFNRAITLKTNPPDCYTNRGNAYYRKGELDRALDDYAVAISLEPSLYQTYFNRGNLHRVRGEPDRALADYNTALSLNPSFDKGYVARGDLYLKAGSVELAVRDYQKACALGNEAACGKAMFPLAGFVTVPSKEEPR